jgi:RNA polymerase sigma factor for flagellar operon FliA
MDDLIQDGFVGLIRAARRCDPGRVDLFRNYAWRAIEGEMRDGLRRMSSGSKEQRRRERRVDEARARLARRGVTTPAALAAELDITPSALAAEEALFHRLSVVSLNVPPYDSAVEVIVDPGESAADRHERAATATTVSDALALLGGRERFVVGMYYWQECTVGEIAEMLDLSVVRTQQILTAGRAHVRALLERGGADAQDD